jgi:hypothetical protein
MNRMRVRPDGCICCDEYGDNTDCDVHARCDYCRTPIGRVDWSTGVVNPWTKSCDCGLELRSGVRGSIVRVLAYVYGQLALTEWGELTDEERYSFDHIGWPE